MLGLLGKKKGMTQIFAANGDIVPVTVVELGPCTVVQRKTSETDGYSALQLGYEVRRPKNVSRAQRGHFEKKGLPLFTHLGEFRVDDAASFSTGDKLFASGFKAGDTVDVRGLTKGRGFQGVMKRHGKHGGPAAHGSDFHRRPGSIGMRAYPGRVLKNTRLPGHMGDTYVTIKNLEVVEVRPDDNVLLIKGAIPGARESLLEVVLSKEKLEIRPELKGQSASAKGSSGEAAEASAEAKETAEEKVK